MSIQDNKKHFKPFYAVIFYSKLNIVSDYKNEMGDFDEKEYFVIG